MKWQDVLVDGLVWWLKVVEGACWFVVEADRQMDRYARGPTRTGARAWEWDETRDGEIDGDGLMFWLAPDVVAERRRSALMMAGYGQKAGMALGALLASYRYPDNGGCLRSYSAERMNTRTMRAWDDYCKVMRDEQEANEHGRHE